MATNYIAPQSDDTEQIGDATHRYKDTYLHKLHIGSGSRLDIYDSNGVVIIEIDDATGRFKLNSTGATSGIRIDGTTGVIAGNLTIVGGEAKDAVINLSADDDDDDPDSWQIKSQASDNKFVIGIWTGAAYTEKFSISSSGLLTITSTGTSQTLAVVSSATVAPAMLITANSLTTTIGSGLRVQSDSASFNSNAGLIDIVVDNSGASGIALRIQQDGSGNILDCRDGAALVFSVADGGVVTFGGTTFPTADGTNGQALITNGSGAVSWGNAVTSTLVNSGSTTQVINIDGAVTNLNTTLVSIVNDAVHAGSGTGSVLEVIQEDASAVANTVQIRNDGTGKGILIDQNGNGVALSIDSEATTASCLSIACLGSGGGVNIVHAGAGRAIDVFSSVATDKAVSISANSLTSGNSCGLWLSTTSSSFSGTSKGFLYVIVDDPSASGTCVKVRQDGSGILMLLGHNSGTNPTIKIESDASSANVIDISGIAGVFVGKAINITSATATTGKGIYIDMSKADYAGDVATFICNGASATGSCLILQNDGTGNAAFIDQNGNGVALKIDSEATSSTIIDIPIGSVFTGMAINITSSTATSGDGIYISMEKSDYSGDVGTFLHAGTSGSGLIVGGTGVFTGNLAFLYLNNVTNTGNALSLSNPSTGGLGAALFIKEGTVELKPAPELNLQVTGGNVIEQTAGSTFNQFDMVRLSVDGKWDKSDATTGTATLAYGMAITAGTDTNTFKVLLPPGAIVRKDAWDWSNPGVLLYAPEGGGGNPTETAPTTGGDLVQKIGFALDDDHAYMFVNLEATVV